jgi:hypothetical protein
MKIDLLKHTPFRAPTHCDPFDSCACNEDETFHPIAYTAKDILDNCDLSIVMLVGNGRCNDEANTADCGYDMGDCCMEPINDKTCTDCICHDDNTRHVGLNSKSSRS